MVIESEVDWEGVREQMVIESEVGWEGMRKDMVIESKDVRYISICRYIDMNMYTTIAIWFFTYIDTDSS